MKYQPMLCKIGTKNDLKNKKYFFEIKFDGTRAICYFKNNKINLINRRNNNITHRFPEFKQFVNLIKTECILDGEIIVYNKRGLPDFNLLQSRDQLDKAFLIEIRSKELPATYIVFDILERNGKSLIHLPLTERKQILKSTIKNNSTLEECVHTEKGQQLWKHVIKKHLEGVIAKEKNSYYQPGKRSNQWLKIKFLKTVDAVIVGYTHEKRIISALCLAIYKDNNLFYIGKVGTGFRMPFLEDLKKKFTKISKVPITNPPKTNDITWVKPKFIAEVEYLEFTKKQHLRVPSFKRLRYDKPIEECDIGQFDIIR